jgi:hypothetical protein
MPVAVTSGIVDTEDRLADEKPVDMADRIAMLDTDTSQFVTILNKLPSKPAKQVKVNWLEDQYFPRASKTAATLTNVATSVTVTTGEGVYFRPGDVVLIAETGEKFRVVSIAGDVLTVVRSVGGMAGTATTIATGDLVILGNASAQGADTGVLKATVRVLGYNYTQIVRDPMGFTGTDAEIELYGADDPEREIAKKAVELKAHLEGLCWAGGREAPTNLGSDTEPTSFMGGITEFLTSNVFTAMGAPTLETLDVKIQQIYQRGSMNKVAFASPLAARKISHLLSNNWVRAQPDERVYGAKVSAFINGAYGESLPIIVKREWGVYQSAGRQLGGAMFILDLDYISRRPMRNRDTKLLPNRQLPGQDRVVFDYLTETSLQLANEAAHGAIYGFAAT